MKTTIRVKCTQFLRPNGRQREVETDLPAECQGAYLEMLAHGCRFEAEMLVTGQVSVTISNGEVDLIMSLIPNGPEVQEAMANMLRSRPWIRQEHNN